MTTREEEEEEEDRESVLETLSDTVCRRNSLSLCPVIFFIIALTPREEEEEDDNNSKAESALPTDSRTLTVGHFFTHQLQSE